ncbi:DarT ssDNA thymidine ADP-ribosyltransferase family protein [Marisediminicola sp. LYQ134]|uniref:DarT ssDNA thymidine ADP-ribosyltransferase family protein n=1 Tax=Marisediminicola sp. LYQ134 TaxID=3391061 RepID=UPI0039837D0A
MIDECIHELDPALCDICSPKVAAPSAPVVRAPRVQKTSLRSTPSLRSDGATTAGTATAGRAQSRSSASSTGRIAGTAPKPVDVAAQRLHHVTHISNLPGILAGGSIVADILATPVVDASSPDNRSIRRLARVAGEGSATVAEHVPFSLSPDGTVWTGMRAGSNDPRVSDAVRALPASEFVILVTTVALVRDAVDTPLVVAEGDAADPRSRFAATEETASMFIARLARDETAVHRAELLVEHAVPFEAITLIGVANDRARGLVREMLADTPHSPRVAVHPPWFAVPEVD